MKCESYKKFNFTFYGERTSKISSALHALPYFIKAAGTLDHNKNQLTQQTSYDRISCGSAISLLQQLLRSQLGIAQILILDNLVQ